MRETRDFSVSLRVSGASASQPYEYIGDIQAPSMEGVVDFTGKYLCN